MARLKPPPAPLPPSPAPKTPEEERREVNQRQTRISYALTFDAEHGKVVLANLKALFGWDGAIERPSYVPGRSPTDVSFIEGQKEVVRHILAMASPPSEQPQLKPTTALS